MFDHSFFGGFRKVEKAHSINNAGFALADAGGDFFRSEVKLGLEFCVGSGELDSVQIFALGVFDDGELEAVLSIDRANNDGNFGEAGDFGGSPAAFAGNDFVLQTVFNDDERLQDAVLLDGVSKHFERGFVKMFTRLSFVADDFFDFDGR